MLKLSCSGPTETTFELKPTVSSDGKTITLNVVISGHLSANGSWVIGYLQQTADGKMKFARAAGLPTTAFHLNYDSNGSYTI